MPAMTPVFCEGTALEPGQHETAARSNDVLQDADDVDLELFDGVTLEDGATDPDHPGAHLVERQENRLSGGGGGSQPGQQRR